MPSADPDSLQAQISLAMAADDWATVAQLEPPLDAAQPPPNRASIIQSALWYTAQGLRVFPLQPGLKIPHNGTRGCLDATTDAKTIRSWWKRWPDSNLAIATGYIVDVIDIDGPVGVASWAVMDNLPPTLGTVSTPRHGGTHLYVAAVEGRGNKAAIAAGVDYRGMGGYVVAPPS